MSDVDGWNLSLPLNFTQGEHRAPTNLPVFNDLPSTAEVPYISVRCCKLPDVLVSPSRRPKFRSNTQRDTEYAQIRIAENGAKSKIA